MLVSFIVRGILSYNSSPLKYKEFLEWCVLAVLVRSIYVYYNNVHLLPALYVLLSIVIDYPNGFLVNFDYVGGSCWIKNSLYTMDWNDLTRSWTCRVGMKPYMHPTWGGKLQKGCKPLDCPVQNAVPVYVKQHAVSQTSTEGFLT